MKKLVVIAQSTDLYGSSQVVVYVAREARRKGWDVCVVLPGNGPLAAELRADSIEVLERPVPSLRRSLLKTRPVRELRTLLQSIRALRKLDAIHGASVVHVVCSTNLAAFCLPRRERRTKAVWSIHEDLSGTTLGRALARLVAASGVARLVCASAYVRDGLPSRRQANAVVIHSGTSLPTDSPGVFDWPFIAEDGVLRLACVGRLNAWKGQDVLIEAVRLLRDRGVRVQTAIVGGVFPGDYDWHGDLRTKIQSAGLNEQVILTGHIDSAWRAFEAADIAVVPSKRPEPFGKVVIEAMLLGKQVIATQPGGPAEVIESDSSGYLVAMNDAEQLADKIEMVARSRDQWSAIAARAVTRAEAFSAQRCGEAYEKVYDETGEN